MTATDALITTPFRSRAEHLDHLARVMRDRAYPEFRMAPTPLWAKDAAETILAEFESLYRAAIAAATPRTLDDAWRECEAALPVGWHITELISPLYGLPNSGGWSVIAAPDDINGPESVFRHGPTPIAALDALRDRLSNPGGERPENGKVVG